MVTIHLKLMNRLRFYSPVVRYYEYIAVYIAITAMVLIVRLSTVRVLSLSTIKMLYPVCYYCC